jgi:hypothetical protein
MDGCTFVGTAAAAGTEAAGAAPLLSENLLDIEGRAWLCHRWSVMWRAMRRRGCSAELRCCVSS